MDPTPRCISENVSPACKYHHWTTESVLVNECYFQILQINPKMYHVIYHAFLNSANQTSLSAYRLENHKDFISSSNLAFYIKTFFLHIYKARRKLWRHRCKALSFARVKIRLQPRRGLEARNTKYTCSLFLKEVERESVCVVYPYKYNSF